MSKTSRSRKQSKVINIPKNLLVCQKRVSAFGDIKSFKSISNLRDASEKRSTVRRGKTFVDDIYEQDIEFLAKVERNYIKEILNSPTKYRSRSPVLSKEKLSGGISGKTSALKIKFDTLKPGIFLQSKIKKSKTSTPCPYYKKKGISK